MISLSLNLYKVFAVSLLLSKLLIHFNPLLKFSAAAKVFF